MTTLKQVLAYARARWAWDDESAIEELVERLYGPDDTPDAFVDALARDYDLLDPRDYGLTTTTIERLNHGHPL